MLSQGIATSLDSLKYDFTIDQIYLFFGKCLKKELDSRKFNAIVLANAVSYASMPPMGADQSYMRKKQQAWDKFMKTLEWNEKPKSKDIREVRSVLSSVGIPVKVIKKGDK